LANVAFSQGMNFFDYFVKPMYWLSIYGIPCAMVIGFTYVGWNNAQQDNARDAASRRP